MTIRRGDRSLGPGARPVRPIARRSPARPDRIGKRGGGRRTGGRFTPVRAGAFLVLLLSLLGGWGLAASPAFAHREIVVEERDALITDPATIEAAVDAIAGGESVFLVETGAIEALLAELPAVLRASVSVGLPGTISVRLEEREPVLAWVVGDRRLAVDATGLVVATGTKQEPGPTRGLVAVTDRRANAPVLAIGSVLDPILLDAATRLGSLRPADVGSTARSLRVSLDDRDGFTVQPLPGGPVAVFGFYTVSLRTPELVPGQVRLLRGLLEGREKWLTRVILASETNGTYVAKPGAPTFEPAPSPSADASFGASPSPVAP